MPFFHSKSLYVLEKISTKEGHRYRWIMDLPNSLEDAEDDAMCGIILHAYISE